MDPPPQALHLEMAGASGPGGPGGPRDTGRTVVRLARLPQENAEEGMICSGLVLDL